MEPVPPFWFRQLQGELESAGENVYRVSAPNFEPAYIAIRQTDEGWQGLLRSEADGPNEAETTRSYESRADAWLAAFELFRTHRVY